jgi:hypothetical protein
MFLGFLSKETALLSPFLFFAVLLIQRRKGFIYSIRLLLPFLFSYSLYFLFRFIALGPALFNRDYVYFIFDPLRYVIDPAVRFYTAFKIAFLYLVKIIAPYNLSATHSYNGVELAEGFFKPPGAFFGLVFIAVLISLAIYKKTRTTPLGIGSLVFLLSYAVYS